ncbi:MAG TPA: SH3 domain-containing protein [Geminicoccaceae bacterium]|nr:SH3 domain-containing protein [Geminicoccaceae bacterium]
MTAQRPRWRTITGVITLVVLLLFDGEPAWAQAGRSTGLPLPRFVSLGADRVNVRFGPGTQYPINWVFARKGLPVEIIEEFDTWRKVRDYDGDEGWIHASLLSSRRTIMVTGEVRDVRRTPEVDSRVVLRAESGVIGTLFDCEEDWCRVEIEGRRGWLQRSEFWGTRPGEILR